MNQTIRLSVLVLIFLFPLASYCQPLPPPKPVPLDGGLGLLLICGARYAYRKLKQSENNEL